MSDLLLSVIIPVYNSEEFLNEMLNSVENQTYKNIEIICINDGSTDSSMDILSAHKNKDNRIKIISQPNLGAGAARNKGLQEASGHYLAILDSDDILENNYLSEMMLSALQHDSDIVICKSDGFRNDKKVDLDFAVRNNFISNDKVILKRDDIKYRAFSFCCGWTWDKLFKKSFIDSYKIKFMECKRADDLFFTFFAVANSETISIVDKYLIHHRYHSKQASANRHLFIDDFIYAVKKLYRELVRSNLYETFRESFIFWLSRYSMWQYNSYKQRNKRLVRGYLRNHLFNEIEILSDVNKSYCDPNFVKNLEEILWDYSLKKPLVSVIVTGYNIEKYITQAIESIIQQTYNNLEIILIDDGSIDGTKKIMEKYAQLDTRIKMYSFKENSIGGVAFAANYGLEVASGEYIVFCDGDDWLFLDGIENFLRKMLATNADIVYAKNLCFLDNEGKIIEHYDYTYWDKLLRAKGIEAKKIMLLMGTEPWKKMYSKHFIDKHSLRFPVGDWFYEDVPFHFFSTILASNIAYLDKHTHIYRIHRKGASTGLKNNQTLKVIYHMNTIYKWLQSKSLLTVYRETLLRKSLRSMPFIIGGLNYKGYYKFYKELGKFYSYFTVRQIKGSLAYTTTIKAPVLGLLARAKRFFIFTIILKIKRGL